MATWRARLNQRISAAVAELLGWRSGRRLRQIAGSTQVQAIAALGCQASRALHFAFSNASRSRLPGARPLANVCIQPPLSRWQLVQSCSPRASYWQPGRQVRRKTSRARGAAPSDRNATCVCVPHGPCRRRMTITHLCGWRCGGRTLLVGHLARTGRSAQSCQHKPFLQDWCHCAEWRSRAPSVSFRSRKFASVLVCARAADVHIPPLTPQNFHARA